LTNGNWEKVEFFKKWKTDGGSTQKGCPNIEVVKRFVKWGGKNLLLPKAYVTGERNKPHMMLEGGDNTLGEKTASL